MAMRKEQLSREDQVTNKVILLVQEDQRLASSLASVLSRETPYHVYCASDVFTALKFTDYVKPHLLILFCRSLDSNPLQLYKHICVKRELAAIPSILLGAHLNHLSDEMKNSKLIVFGMPYDLDDVVSTIDELLASSGL
jgi:DNA-binding NtrC family response regulator